MREYIIDSNITILEYIAKDIIEIDGRCRESIGGSVYYGGIARSHMGLKMSVITFIRKNF